MIIFYAKNHAESSLQACVGSEWMPPSSCASNAIATVDCDIPSFRVYNATNDAFVETLSVLRPIAGELQIHVFDAWYPVCAASFNNSVFTICDSLRLQIHELAAPAPCVLWQECGKFVSVEYQLRYWHVKYIVVVLHWYGPRRSH